jgi:hypothetical protein
MPRKRWSFVTTVEPQEPPVAPGAPSLEALVQATLIDFDELAQLPTSVKDQLVRALIESIRRARAGLSFRKKGVGDQYQTKAVFVADLAAALTAAGLRPTRWRKTYDGGDEDHESLLFRLARALVGDAGLELPTDMKDLGQASTNWRS